MAFLSRFNRPKQAALHSHAIASANEQQAQTIGSTSNASFSQRQAIDKRRQHIGNYRYSAVASAPTLEERSTAPQDSDKKPVSSLQESPTVNRQKYNATSVRSSSRTTGPVQAPPRTGFREPPSRGYNHYA